MVNLWFFSLSTLTSVGLNVNAGKNIVASFIDASGLLGTIGVSAPIPSLTLIFPLMSIERTANFGKKYSKSLWILAPGWQTSTVEEPVPSYCLWKKSKEFPVTSSIVASVADVPVISSTLGRKSYVSIRGNSPEGLGASGSTFVAEYVGMSSKSIWFATSTYESTVRTSPEPCSK